MEKIIDLFTASEYDLIVGKDRDLDLRLTCTYLDATGGTRYFDFTTYTGATLTIKNRAGTILMQFTTSGGSITLYGDTGVFKLTKTYAEMDKIRAGQYDYDMVLSNATYARRAFLWGNITFIQNITN